MSVEHRGGNRRPLVVDIMIDCPRLGLMPARTRDVGLGGMFVETARSLVVNQIVTVRFGSAPAGPVYRWQAVVVHTTPHGAGLMFDGLEPAELAAVLEALRAAHADAASVTPSAGSGTPGAGGPEDTAMPDPGPDPTSRIPT